MVAAVDDNKVVGWDEKKSIKVFTGFCGVSSQQMLEVVEAAVVNAVVLVVLVSGTAVGLELDVGAVVVVFGGADVTSA